MNTSVSNPNKIRVLIVDDSISMRKFFTSLLSYDQKIEVVGDAPDPIMGLELLKKLRPDVMTLDLRMPKMDGLTFLRQAMQEQPTPTLIVSSFATENSKNALKALELGAIDIFPKQILSPGTDIKKVAQQFITKVRLVSSAICSNQIIEKLEPKPQSIDLLPQELRIQLLAFAASTGGTEALKFVLSQLPANIPATLIVQHMQKEFLESYAETLAHVCRFEVKVAVDHAKIEPGKALLAPGDKHMEVCRNGHELFVKIKEGPFIHGVRPSAEPLFLSVAEHFGKKALGVILTGMGADGSNGLLQMKKAGSFNIAQDEKTSVVFGMPRVAIEKGAIDVVLPLQQIAERIIAECSKTSPLSSHKFM